MIKYALLCQTCQSKFDAWFSNSGAYDEQHEKGLVECPECGACDVTKQIMAPTLKGTKKRDSDAQIAALAGDVMKRMRKHVADNYDYVGSNFAEEARAMHRGETDERPVWGETTPKEAKSLIEEGIPATPMPKAITPPKPVEPKKLN